MPSFYEKLVAKYGETEAKIHMAEIRTKRKKPGYFATLSKEELQEFQRKGVQKRASKKIQRSKSES